MYNVYPLLIINNIFHIHFGQKKISFNETTCKNILYNT